MRAVLTRVTSASVSVDGEAVGAIGKGFLILLGVHVDDTETDADRIADRICGLRIFEDDAGKMNVSPADAGAEMLILHADCLKDAEWVRDQVRAAHPELGEIAIGSLGVVIGAHTGPGLLAVFYYCGERKPM